MVELPRLTSLEVQRYGLYPGEDGSSGLQMDCSAPTSVVLGANGLGKTTLVTLAYRLLSGPYDIPGLETNDELGSRNLTARQLPTAERRIFAVRVADQARDASATAQFTLGARSITVVRNLHDLSLSGLAIDGQEVEPTEDSYQSAIVEIAGLGAYGDWILLLRHLTFYFEDRRALVWDPSAQRHLIRLLFLPPETSRRWVEYERQVISLDSAYRNARVALNRQKKQLDSKERQTVAAPELTAELEQLQGEQIKDQEALETVENQIPDAEGEVAESTLLQLRTDMDFEQVIRDIERAQLIALRLLFPHIDATAEYIIGHLLATSDCLVCESHVPGYAKSLTERLSHSSCVLCGTDIAGVESTPVVELDEMRARRDRLVEQRGAAALRQTEAEAAAADLSLAARELRTRISQRASAIARLQRRLPESDTRIRELRAAIAIGDKELEESNSKLAKTQSAFSEFIDGANREIVRLKDEIKQVFDTAASGFLEEEAVLRWAPRNTKVGEGGFHLDFPAFELDMTGSDFATATRRSGPEQVSESQREFVDLSFRMSLMSAATQTGATLLIDAPESSLDAVFVDRAAEVLAGFHDLTSSGNLIVTSNLVDGDLIPSLLHHAGIDEPTSPAVLDLLKVATPTAATLRWADAYAAARDRVFARARGLGGA